MLPLEYSFLHVKEFVQNKRKTTRGRFLEVTVNYFPRTKCELLQEDYKISGMRRRGLEQM